MRVRDCNVVRVQKKHFEIPFAFGVIANEQDKINTQCDF